jgi:AraC family transcriptional regulator of adaptative response / DNA-3-methyladenine glycosylase II
MLDHDTCYDALLRRDDRYDGLFFVAVCTTGIYCRPVCPARTPLRRNVTFYETPPQAEEAGYRPCLRCRPESAPDSPAWLGSQASVNRALRLIEEGGLAETRVSDFAERLGVTDRHLRRLFLKHLGVGPLAVEQTRRVHLAKKLLHETRLSMTDVAFAAGFGSLRRFNETFRQLFRRPPSAIRRDAARARPPQMLRLRLDYRPGFDWQARVGGGGGDRRLRMDIDGRPIIVAISQRSERSVWLEFEQPPVRELARIIARVKREFLPRAAATAPDTAGLPVRSPGRRSSADIRLAA